MDPGGLWIQVSVAGKRLGFGCGFDSVQPVDELEFGCGLIWLWFESVQPVEELEVWLRIWLLVPSLFIWLSW